MQGCSLNSQDLGLGLEAPRGHEKWSWSWSWLNSLNIFKTLMNDKDYKLFTNLIISNTSLFQHFLVLLWQSSNPSCSVAMNVWHKGEMWQLVVNETNIHFIHYWIRIAKLHNDWNGMDICLTNNHLPNISCISLIWSESETNVELHPKLKLTTVLKFKEHYSFTTILLYIPVCVLVEKTIN